MKCRLYIIIGSLALASLSSSCSDYLKEDSGDLLIPEKVEEFQSVLYGEGYPESFADDASFMDLMTDDVAVVNGTSEDLTDGSDNINIPTGRGAYLWAYDIEYYLLDAGTAYENRYKNILTCNTIIEHESDMIGTASDINYCVAQAYAMRAYSYFCLVNWYGVPYNKETADTDMGVAIRLDSEVTREQFKRSSVQAVYDQINQDLDRALELFNQTTAKENKYLMSKKAALLLKSRVALFTENWDDVIRYGEELYNMGLSLQQIGTLTAEQMANSYSFINSQNVEILFNFGGKDISYHKYMTPYSDDLAGPMFAPSQTEPDDLLNIYEEGDNRYYAFFKQDEDWLNMGIYITHYQHIPIKFMTYDSDCYQQAFRTAEVLLNLAEGYIRKGDNENLEKAVSMLNELREARFTPDKYIAKSVSDFATADELLKFVWAERRRELCFDETHRWNDLRRQGMPRIVHKFWSARNATVETYVLEQGDVNYTLALPKSETSYNTQIEVYNRRNIEAQ